MASEAHEKYDGRTRVFRSEWIDAARRLFIEGGVENVKIDVISRELKITRGSFYARFESREELLQALIEDWQNRNNTPVIDAIRRSGARGKKADFTIIGDLWIDEKDFDPRYDSAMRDWARKDEAVAAIVHRIDDIRIGAFTDMFMAYGFDRDEAFIRARITYFHQVGYYALGVRETPEERLRLGPLYDKVLLD